MPAALFTCASCFLGWTSMPVLAQDALRRRGLEANDSKPLRLLCALVCASGAFLAWNLLRNPVSCVVFTLACACMGLLLCCDLRHHVLPTGFVGAMLLLAIVFRVIEGGMPVCLQCIGIGACIALALVLANAIHMHVRARIIIGAGDVRMVVPLVIFSGIQGLGMAVFLASLAMGTIALAMLATARKRRDSFVALAPGLTVWLFAGTLIPFA